MGALDCRQSPDIVVETKYPLVENIKFVGMNDYRGEIETDEKDKKKAFSNNNNLYDQEHSQVIGNAYEVPINISSSQLNNEEDYESSNKELSTNINNQNILVTDTKNHNEINEKIKESLELYKNDLINKNKNVNRFMDFTFPKESVILKKYEEEKFFKDNKNLNNNKKVKEKVKKTKIKASNNKNMNMNEQNLKVLKNNNTNNTNNKYKFRNFKNNNQQNNNLQNKDKKDLNTYFFTQKNKNYNSNPFISELNQNQNKKPIIKVKSPLENNNNNNIKIKKLPLDRTDSNNQIKINDIKNINSLSNINNINNVIDNKKNQNIEKINQKKYAKDDLNIVAPQDSTRISLMNTYDKEKEIIELKNKYLKSQTPPTFSNLRESQASSFYINNFLRKENNSSLIRDKSAKFSQVMNIPGKQDIIDIFKQEKDLNPEKTLSSYERLGVASTKKLSNNEYFDKIISQSAGTYNLNQIKQIKENNNINYKDISNVLDFYNINNVNKKVINEMPKQNEYIVKDLPEIIEESYNNNFMKNSNISDNMNDLTKNLYSSNINAETTPLKNQENNNESFAEVIFLSKSKKINQIPNNEIKNINARTDKNELPEVFNSSNINNFGSFLLSKTDKDEFGNKDLNLEENNNLKETNINEFKEFEINNLNNSNNFATITKLNENQFDTKENPEVFNYSNINNINNITFSNKKEDNEYYPTEYDTLNIYNSKEENNKEKIKTDKIEFTNSPEIFDSFNINTLKQPTTTLIKIEDNFKQNFDSDNINNFNQIENISSTNLNMKDFNYDKKNENIDSNNSPEILETSNINNKVETTNEANEYNFELNNLIKEINYSNINYINEDKNKNKKEAMYNNENNNEFYELFDFNNLNDKINSSKIIKDNINNLNQEQNITTKKLEENDIIKDIKHNIQNLNIDKNNLSKVYSSPNMNYKKQNINQNNDNNQNKEFIEKIINMKELPKVFGSSDIKIKQKISVSCQTEEKVSDLPDVFGSYDINNYSKDNNIKENENINMKDLQDFSTTYHINDLKNQKTNLINKEENINKKELPEVFPSSNIIPTKTIYKNSDFYIKEDIRKSINNNFNQTENITTKKLEENNIIKDIKYNIQNLNIDKNNLSKVYSSPNMNYKKQNINQNNDNNQNKEFIEKIINMKELPKVFGSSDIKIKQKISVPCLTEEKVSDLPDVFGSFDINNYCKDNNIKENENINLEDINNLKQPKRTLDLTKEDINKKDLSEDFILSNDNINQNVINEININNQENLNNKDLPELMASSNFNNINPTSIIDINKSIDMKDLPEAFGSYNIKNLEKDPKELNINIKVSENNSIDYGFRKEQNKLLVPISRNKSYIQHIKQNIHSNSNPFDYKQSKNMNNSSSFSYYSLKKKNNQPYEVPILKDLSNLNQTSNIQSSRITYANQIDINNKTENEIIENNYNPYSQGIKNTKSYQNINIIPMENIDLKSFNNDKREQSNSSMALYKSINNNNFNNLRAPTYSGTKYNTIYSTGSSSSNIFGNKIKTKKIFYKKNGFPAYNYTYNSPGNLSTNIIKTDYS